MRYLFLSPHLDDAVLGCGAFMAKAIAAGHEAAVISCFTSPGVDASPEEEAIYQQRITDDCCAMSQLGVSYRHLGFVDAPFRRQGYYNFNTLLFHHRLPESERAVTAQLTEQLEELTLAYNADHLFLPLGVGGHIDHHLLWEACKPLWNRRIPITFYEEQPYTFLTGWAAIRWQQLGANASRESDQRPIEKIPLSGSPYPFVHNYITSTEDWLKSRQKYDAEFSETPPVYTNQWNINGRIFDRWEDDTREEHLKGKRRAILEYSTEWPALFGPDRENLLHSLKQYPAREKGWTLKIVP